MTLQVFLEFLITSHIYLRSKNSGHSKFYTYLSSTDATLPSPSKSAPFERRLAMNLRSSGSTSDGRLVSTEERLDKGKTHIPYQWMGAFTPIKSKWYQSQGLP
jgi:hypothetical protein